jgi:hypothetical protein
MRILKFIVEGQILKPDPDCDFSGLVPGTEGYLQAEFSFSPEWNNCAKAVEFYSIMGREYPCCQVLKNGKTCLIPSVPLERRAFKIRIVGKCVGSKTLTTNKIEIKQDGGKT